MEEGNASCRTLLLPAALFLVIQRGALAEGIAERDAEYYQRVSAPHVFTNAAGQTLPYRLFVPPGKPPGHGFPLVLVFHGAGSRGNDNRSQLKPWFAGWMDASVQNLYPCIILLPQCPAGKRWVNQPWNTGSYSMAETPISEPMLLAREVLDEVCRRHHVDASRIYVMGASMGGYAAWYFAAAYPEVPAAVVAVCGAGDPSMAFRLKHLPVWAFHGALDRTVPPSRSSDMIEAIRNVGGTKARLTIYPDVDHTSFKLAWKEPELLVWLFSQSR